MSAYGTKRTFQRAQAMSALRGKADIAAHCSGTMSSRLRRLAGKRIIHPPYFGPCLHAIRSNDLMPPLGWEKSGVEARKCERRLGRRLSFNG